MNEIEEARRAVDSWRLGRTSARYESSGQGAGTISTGKGDHGGVSYGTYQFSTKMGTLSEYLRQSRYGESFQGLAAGTTEFNEKWKTLAKSDPGFAEDQRDFIGKSHYDEQLEDLKRVGIDLSDRGRAVRDAVWSTSVQFRGLTPKIFVDGISEKYGEGAKLSQLTDSQIIEAVQNYKIGHNASLFKSSPEWQPGLLRRANAEKIDLLKLAAQERLVDAKLPQIAENASSPSVERKKFDSVDEAGRSAIERVGLMRSLQTDLRHLGYGDNRGCALVPDGIPGPNTLHAIKSFQHAHHLHVDGIVGPRTLAALEDAKRYPLLSEATNPHRHLYAQVFAGIRALPRDMQPTGRALENTAVALTVSAATSGLQHVDHVVLGSDGLNLFAVQGRMNDPAHRRTHVALAHAVVHATDHRALATAQPAHGHAHPHPLAVALQQDAPRAPVMAGP